MWLFVRVRLLSVPGKVVAHVLSDCIKPLINAKRRQEQIGFTPAQSTVDCILTLGILAQPLYAAYIDLKPAFDSVDRGVLRKLMRVLELPPKIISIIEALYSNTVSCVRVDGNTGDVIAYVFRCLCCVSATNSCELVQNSSSPAGAPRMMFIGDRTFLPSIIKFGVYPVTTCSDSCGRRYVRVRPR